MRRALAPPKSLCFLGRFGYAARALVYGLVGAFAVLMLFGWGGELTDTRGILLRLLKQPFGTVGLFALAVGLFCFSLWRLYQAISDTERQGTGAKGWVVRLGYGLSALTHAGLGFYALNLIFRLRALSQRSGEGDLAQRLLAQDFGSLATALVALVLTGVGLCQFYVAFAEKFRRGLELPHGSQWLCRVCKAGIAAQPFGELWIGAVAVGLVAFAVYGFTEALYRRSLEA